MARHFRPRWRRCDFPDRGGHIASKKKFFVTVLDAALLYRSEWRQPRPRSIWRDLSEQCGDGANSQTEAETARFFRSSERGRGFPGHRGDGATKNQFLATTIHMARLIRTMRRRRDFPDRGGYGATFQIKRERARLSRQSWRRRDQEPIPRDQGGNHSSWPYGFSHTTRFFRLQRRRRDFSDRGRDGATKIIFLAIEVETVRFFRLKRRRSDFPGRRWKIKVIRS